MGPVRQTQSRELLGLFMCVCIALCTIVAHNIAQNRPDNFPSYPPDNHHCSNDVYLREGGTAQVAICLGYRAECVTLLIQMLMRMTCNGVLQMFVYEFWGATSYAALVGMSSSCIWLFIHCLLNNLVIILISCMCFYTVAWATGRVSDHENVFRLSLKVLPLQDMALHGVTSGYTTWSWLGVQSASLIMTSLMTS